MIVVDCLLQGRGDKAEVDKRVAQLRDEIETSPSDWEKEKLKERLAKLSNGVAAIKARSLPHNTPHHNRFTALFPGPPG